MANNVESQWPYTHTAIHRSYHRKRRNREAKCRPMATNVQAQQIQETQLSPRQKNQVNVVLQQAEKLGMIATEEGNTDLVGLAAMVSTTFEMLMDEGE